MSFFNKILASAGIGSAKVDTLVDQAVYVPGEELSGIMRIKGGKIDQEIGKIDIELKTEYIVEHDDKNYHHLLHCTDQGIRWLSSTARTGA